MAETIKIGGELESTATGNVVAAASAIKDKVKNMYQSEINAETDTHLTALDTKTDNTNNAIGAIDNRLSTVEELAEISVGGGDIGIATAADFESDNPSDLAKVPTVGAMLGGANDGVYDISARHNGTKYADLAEALGTNGANIPVGVRRPGMSVKFVQSSDNKYVQYRLMSDSFNTTVANWQGVDDEPIAGSENLAKSGGTFNNINRSVSNTLVKGETFFTPLPALSQITFITENGEPVSRSDQKSWGSEIYIPAESLKSIVKTTDTRVVICFYDENKVFKYCTYYTTGTVDLENIIGRYKYLRFSINKNDWSVILEEDVSSLISFYRSNDIIWKVDESEKTKYPVAGSNKLLTSGGAKNTETYNKLAIYDSFQYDESKLIPFCIGSSNKWQNQGYHVLIPLNDEKEITILRNKRSCVFAFLKSYSFNLRNGDDVDFSDTYASRIILNNDNFSATYPIPSDAKYICFSIATEEKELCFPSVVFSNETLADVNKKAISKEGDFDKIPLKNDDAANPAFTIDNENKWTSTSGATTMIWEIDGIANRKIRLVNIRDSAIILYFLTKEYSTPTDRAYVPICANTTRVSVAVGDDVIMDVPYDCKYIYVSKLTPVYVLQNTKTSLENLNEAIKSEVTIDYIDYVDYRIPWVLNYSSGGKWRNEGRSYTIPVKANSTIKMTTPAGGSIYAFLRTNLPISDTLGDFVTDTSITRITPGTTVIVTAPNVDSYLYVTDLPTASSSERDSRLPVTTMNALLPKNTFNNIKQLEERVNTLENKDNYNLSEFGVGKDNEIWLTSWFNPQAIETSKYRKKLIWGWCDDIGCTGVSEFDSQTKLIKRTVLKQIAEADDHNSCFVIELQDGRIGVGYHGNHMGNNAELNNYLYIRISNTRDLVDGFGNVIRIHGTMRMNYGQCFYLNGKYYLFFRYGTSYWGYVVSDDFVNWSEPKAIFSTQNQFYIRFTKVADNANVVRLCLYEHPDFRSDIKMGFFDAETGNILNSDSNHTVLGNIEDESPIAFSSFNTIVSVAENKKIRLYEAAVTNMDTSIIAISDFTSAQNSSEYYIARDGVREFVAAGGKDLIVNDYPLGFAIIDSNNVVVCRGASDGKDYVDIMTYSNGEWGLADTIYSEYRNGVIDVNNNRNTRPMVSDKGHYILWQRGYYSFYSDGRYSTDAMIYDIVNDDIY